jgi:hypothetical protein
MDHWASLARAGAALLVVVRRVRRAWLSPLDPADRGCADPVTMHPRAAGQEPGQRGEDRGQAGPVVAGDGRGAAR